MGRGRLADLHGLMTFLQLQPWGERAWWSHAIEAPLTGTSGGGGRASERDRAEAECRLLSLLHALMWRNSKSSVSVHAHACMRGMPPRAARPPPDSFPPRHAPSPVLLAGARGAAGAAAALGDVGAAHALLD